MVTPSSRLIIEAIETEVEEFLLHYDVEVSFAFLKRQIIDTFATRQHFPGVLVLHTEAIKSHFDRIQQQRSKAQAEDLTWEQKEWVSLLERCLRQAFTGSTRDWPSAVRKNTGVGLSLATFGFPTFVKGTMNLAALTIVPEKYMRPGDTMTWAHIAAIK